MSENATAVNAVTESGEQIVGIGSLRVVLMQEGKSWFAQALDIDYVAQGATIEEARRNFEIGFLATVRENLRMHGDIRHILTPAPAPVWMDLMDPKGKPKRFSSRSIQIADESEELSGVMPFHGINYLQAEANV